MDDSTYISIKGADGRYDDFVRFMSATTSELKNSADTKKIDYSKFQGEKLEGVVLEQMKALAKDFSFNPDNIIHTEKQHFPDIISENYFGVEVKATKDKSWTSTGSSITESLREDCVKKIFLLFGRLSVPEVDFRCKPYEDCLCDISVTHNPRYLINMDLSKEDKTIFEKIGMEYDQFRTNDNRIDLIRNYYREKYKDNGREMPWWIGEDPENSIIRNEGSIRLYSTASQKEKDYIRLCGYILFPEVLNSHYSNLALWLCSRHSIVNPSTRDIYSAGGQMNVYINNKLIRRNVSKSTCNFLMFIDKIRDVFLKKEDVYQEISYYSDYYSENKDLFSEWKNVVGKIIDKNLNLNMEYIMTLTFKGLANNNKDILMEVI